MRDWDKPIDRDALRKAMDAGWSCSYEPPITVYNKIVKEHIEQRENEVYSEVIEQMAVDIDKEELKRALAYDRDQFRQGYEAGLAAGYAEGSQDILQVMIDILKANGYKVELGD